MKIKSVLIFLLIGFNIYALPKHFVSTNNITIGETFVYNIELPPDQLDKINLPTINGLETLSSQVSYTSTATIHEFELQLFSIEQIQIPTLSLLLNGMAPIELPPINLNLKSVVTSTMNQLNDIDPLFDIFYINWLLLSLILIGVFVLGIIIFTWRYKKNKKIKIKTKVQVVPAYKIAIKRLNDLNEQLLNDPQVVKKGYFELTEIICRYLTDICDINFLDATTVEMQRLLKQKNPLNPEISNQIIIFAKEMDQYKFTKKPILELDRLQFIIQEIKKIIRKVEQ